MLISLSAVMLVPSPSFRSMAGGIMLSVVFVLAATRPIYLICASGGRSRALCRAWIRSGRQVERGL